MTEPMDVHTWFNLTYAGYAVQPRALLDKMPLEWQHRYVELMKEMGEVFEWPPDGQTCSVLVRDDVTGRFVHDPLRNYRYADVSRYRVKSTREQG